MDTNDKKAIKKLIQLNLDSAKNYKVAAKNTDDKQLKTFLDKTSIEREETMRKLKEITGATLDEASLKEELSQFWLNLKTATKKFEDHEIIQECISSEKRILEQYDKILEKGATYNLTDEVKSQRNTVERNYEELLNMKEKYKELDKKRNRETPV